MTCERSVASSFCSSSSFLCPSLTLVGHGQAAKKQECKLLYRKRKLSDESGVLNLPYQVISIHVLEAAPRNTASLLSPSPLQLALTLLIWAVSLRSFSACSAHHRHYNTYETSQSRHSRLQTKALSSLLFHLKDFQL